MKFCGRGSRRLLLSYLGSFLSSNSNSDKDCLTRIGKAASVFGRLKAVWKNKYISFPVKVKLYES